MNSPSGIIVTDSRPRKINVHTRTARNICSLSGLSFIVLVSGLVAQKSILSRRADERETTGKRVTM